VQNNTTDRYSPVYRSCNIYRDAKETRTETMQSNRMEMCVKYCADKSPIMATFRPLLVMGGGNAVVFVMFSAHW
jgi:hypothetical protein